MTLLQKLDYLQSVHLAEWVRERRKVEDKLSAENTYFCLCGRLATGFHEMSCKRFKSKVNSVTINNLKHLLPKKKRTVKK